MKREYKGSFKTVEDKLTFFGSLGYEITLVQWQDEHKHWRLGLDWKDKDNYFYICEMPTIEECVDRALLFILVKE